MADLSSQKICGIVDIVRNMGGIIFFNILDGTRYVKCCVERDNPDFERISKIKIGFYISVLFDAEDRNSFIHRICRVIDIHPLVSPSAHSLNRHDILLSVLQQSVHEFESSNNTVNVVTPHILPGQTKADCFNVSFFSKDARLTSSNALYLDCLACKYSKVYSIHPVFRAEPSHTRVHLSEFLLWEHSQLGFSLDHLQDYIECAIRTITEKVCARMGLEKPFDTDLPFNTKEYKDISLGKEFKTFSQFEKNYRGNRPLFVYKLPTSLASWRAERISSTFTSSFNLIFPGVGEVAEGSIRTVSLKELKDKIENSGQARHLSWMLDFARFENLKVGCFGLGIERLAMTIIQASNIRDIKTFYRDWRFSEL